MLIKDFGLCNLFTFAIRIIFFSETIWKNFCLFKKRTGGGLRGGASCKMPDLCALA